MTVMTTMYWLLLGSAALVAGIFNLPHAFEKLEETCRGLLLFKPLKSPGFWVWIIIQVLFPAGIFLVWITDLFTQYPPIDLVLFLKAIAAGFGFIAFLNARTETVFLTIDIKSIYDRLIVLGFKLIAAQETRRTARFLRQLEDELSQPTADLVEGLKDLRAYFSADISLTPKAEETYLNIINQALTEMSPIEQISAIQSLLPAIRQNDLLYTLQQFKCSDVFLERYFDTKSGQTKSGI